MQAHINKCEAAKRKATEADESFRELRSQGLLTAVEPAWKWQWLELSEVCLGYLFSECGPAVTYSSHSKELLKIYTILLKWMDVRCQRILVM